MARFTLRLPESMKAWIEKQAKSSGRTMNSEFVELVREAMQKEKEDKQKAA